jgi:hypothetical protein
MPASKPFIVAVFAIALALMAAAGFESVYQISIRTRPSNQFVRPTNPAEDRPVPSRTAFTLRLVDSGGVGIPLDGDWGKDYSHDRRVFRDVILQEPPYVNDAAFQRVDREWRSYVDRMLEYGNNAIAVPLLLELIDFDRLSTDGPSGRPVTVYERESPFLVRHAAIRGRLAPLFEWTDRRGMQVFLDTDMLALTPPLSDLLRNAAPSASAVGIDASHPAVWAVYRAGLEELFDEMPFIQGVVIRFGEGGSLHNGEGWPYRSEMAIRNAASLRAMLNGLLPLFEARGKTLVLRSWTVGVGQIGRLHIDPAVYESVLGDIDSPALIVSTKFTAGDFFSYLPLNPTLTVGRHRRIVELQAKPEFEGFGAFPNFLGEEHARALRVLGSANPRIVGTYVLPQFGGPLRAGPRTLYPLHGFWLWTDANVFVASRLAVDPDADVSQLARAWAAARFSDDPRIVDAITRAMAESRDVVLKGFYIRSFAEHEVRVPGLELPPLMWIFEWDMVGGWHNLLSIVYQGSRDGVDLAIEEGHAAAAIVRKARRRLQAAVEAAGAGARAPSCHEALRSLEYQETLFDALAAWRQAFLSYYRWLDTGETKAWTAWRDGRRQFDPAADRHMVRFGNDLDFPAFDLTSARQAVIAAERGVWARSAAVGLVIGVLALLYLGSPLGRRWTPRARFGALTRFSRLGWTAAVVPRQLAREPVDLRSSIAVTTLALTLVGVFVVTLTGFTTAWLGAGSLLLLAVVALAFESTATGAAAQHARGRLLVASVGPLIPGVTALLALIAYFGPLGLWYSFWISPGFRAVFLTVGLATLLWTAYGMYTVRALDDWRIRIGGSLATAGAVFVALTVFLPDWVAMLRFLDRPLNMAPATDTMLFALRTYAGVSLDAGGLAWVPGLLLLAGGYAMCLRSASSTPRQTLSAPDPDPAADVF